MLILLLVVLVLAPPALAKDKKKQVLPDYVLRAQTLVVVIHPDAGEPLTNPTANRTAQDNVERALMKWGRFKLVMDAQTADLVVAVRKGHASGPTITNSPTDNPPLIYQPSGRDTRAGGQQGRPPDLSNPGLGGAADRGPPDRGPRIGNEIGSSDDTFEVYRGGVEHPLDTAPVWRHMAKGALNLAPSRTPSVGDEPKVPAVEQFRKAIDESEKQHQQKP
jgi:hypothetical protein